MKREKHQKELELQKNDKNIITRVGEEAWEFEKEYEFESESIVKK